MKLSYDPKHNIAYIGFREKSEEVETIRVSDEVNLDVAPDGSLYGIELLNANEQLGGGDQAIIHIINEATGGHSELKLPA